MGENKLAERFYQYTPEERSRIYVPYKNGSCNPD
jgi:hypothetical protein